MIRQCHLKLNPSRIRRPTLFASINVISGTTGFLDCPNINLTMTLSVPQSSSHCPTRAGKQNRHRGRVFPNLCHSAILYPPLTTSSFSPTMINVSERPTGWFGGTTVSQLLRFVISGNVSSTAPVELSVRPPCHSSDRDACPQGWPGVARPSNTSAKNIGREECRESRRKNVDQSNGSG